MPILTVPAERPPVALRRMCVDDVPMLLALESDRYSTGVAGHGGARRRELLDWLREAPGKLGHWAGGRRRRGRLGSLTPRPAPTASSSPTGCNGARRAAPPQPAASCATMHGACWMSRPRPPSPGRTTRARARKLGFVQAGTETHYGRDTVAYLLPRPASA